MTNNQPQSDFTNEVGRFVDEMVSLVTGETVTYGVGDQQVTLRLDPHLVAQIDGAAKFFEVSRSSFIARLLYDAFEDFDAQLRDSFRAKGLAIQSVNYLYAVHGTMPEDLGEKELGSFADDIIADITKPKGEIDQ